MHYADEKHCSFSLFCLPAYALSNPTDNIVEVETVDEDGGNDYEDDYITPPQGCNNKCPRTTKQSTINPDSSVFGKEGTADETADKRAANNDAIGGTATTHKYTMTSPDD